MARKRNTTTASSSAPSAPSAPAPASDGAEARDSGVRPAPTREDIVEAVYLEQIERGSSERIALAIAEDVADRLGLAEASPRDDELGYYDLTAEQDYEYPGGARKTLMRAGLPVMRDPRRVDTIVVHQTAVEFGVSDRAIRAADGDRELALARRALDVACHAMAFRDGFSVLAHPLLAWVNGGNGWNKRGVNVEIEGRYPGLADDPSTVAREDLRTTWGGTPSELTELTIAAARDALRRLVEEEGPKVGITLRRIVSHRQSSPTRRSDPGEAIWKAVVLEYAAPVLGLEVVREAIDRGRPVPLAWDPEGRGSY